MIIFSLTTRVPLFYEGDFYLKEYLFKGWVFSYGSLYYNIPLFKYIGPKLKKIIYAINCLSPSYYELQVLSLKHCTCLGI